MPKTHTISETPMQALTRLKPASWQEVADIAAHELAHEAQAKRARIVESFIALVPHTSIDIAVKLAADLVAEDWRIIDNDRFAAWCGQHSAAITKLRTQRSNTCASY